MNPAFRKPFKPPTDARPLVIRSIHYAGEQHPARLKRVIVVPVARLPLKDKHAIHKLKLLAGVRWTPEAPADAGLSPAEKELEHGFIKISCEDFPRARMNLKWISDTIDRLVAEANVCHPLLETTCFILFYMFIGYLREVYRHSGRHATYICEGTEGKEGRTLLWTVWAPTLHSGLP